MPGRILIVDDVPSSRLVARAKLSMAYYDVVEAGSGEEALAVALVEEPDLILLDVMMAGIDGFETCRRLKADPRSAHIPVVMLSSLSNRADRMRGLESGADDFLTKPFEDTALLSRVSSLTRMKMMIDELRLRAETSRELGLKPASDVDARLNYADASILLVSDDDALAADALAQLRRSLGAAVERASGDAETQALMKSNSFDAFVIGPSLADGEPLRLASNLRGRPNTRQAALTMVFRAEDRTSPPLALDMGVTDYLVMPLDLSEMAARLKVQLRRKHYSDQLRKSVEDSLALAVIDPLTGLYNRRYANAHIDSLLARSKGEPGVAAMVLDLDRFKAVNDAHGHGAGDLVLVEFAERLRQSFRPADLISRIGGEEFLVVMPEILPEHAKKVAERARHAVERPKFALEAGRRDIAITVSIGLAMHRPGESGAALIERADAALYASKAAGRNMVTLAAA